MRIKAVFCFCWVVIICSYYRLIAAQIRFNTPHQFLIRMTVMSLLPIPSFKLKSVKMYHLLENTTVFLTR